MGINGFDADLFDAVEFGDVEWAQQSIGGVGVDGKPININAQDSNGETILMLASRYGHIEIVHFLLARGADPTIRDNQDQTALMKAKARGHNKVIESLIQSGAKS